MEVLDAINRTGTTIVMATHNEEIVNSMRKRVVELHTGKIVRDEQQGSYDSALYFPDAEVESKSHQALALPIRTRNTVDRTPSIQRTLLTTPSTWKRDARRNRGERRGCGRRCRP